MYLNPFLNVNHQQNIYYFSEKYSDSKKPFLSLKTSKNMKELMNDKRLNKKITQHLHYPFAISSDKFELFSMLQENVELSQSVVNKFILSRCLMLKLYNASIKILNYSKLNIDRLAKVLEVDYGSTHQVIVIIKDNMEEVINLESVPKNSFILFYEVDDSELVGVGPFLEVVSDKLDLTKYQEKKIIEKVVTLDDRYWKRPIEEVILDTTLSAITDFFAEYITIASPFIYKKAILKDKKLCLCESYDII